MTPSWIIVHHTASPRDTTTVAAVNQFHKTKNWGTAAAPAYAHASTLGSYVQYHYFIDHAGVVTKCAEDTEIRWHSGTMNDKALGVCLAGWFNPGHDTAPTQAQVDALKTLLQTLSQTYTIPAEKIVPHRTFANKTCYGSNLANDWAAKLIAQAPAPAPTPAPTPAPAPMPVAGAFPVYKQQGQGTLYVRIGNTLVRISTDWNTYVQNVGNAVPITELSPADFAKWTIAPGIAVTKL